MEYSDAEKPGQIIVSLEISEICNGVGSFILKLVEVEQPIGPEIEIV